MTNEQIIFNESQRLAEEGIIDYTGEVLTFEDAEGNKIEVNATEAIHTYQKWKSLGYQVRKGEKAIAKFTIWKFVQGKKKDDEEEEKSKMFMKNSAFFKASQVEKID